MPIFPRFLVTCFPRVLTLLILLASGAAAADGEILIRQGVELRRQGNNAAAAVKFEEAYGELHSARSAAQLGLCEQALARWLLAESHLREALAGESDPWIRRNRKTLETALATVRSNLAHLVLNGSPSSASVRLGDDELGALSQGEYWVLPQESTLVVTAAGFKPFKQKLVLRPGQRAALGVRLNEQEPVPALSPPEVPAQGLVVAISPNTNAGMQTDRRWLWWAAGGVAITAVVVTALILSSGGNTPAQFDERRMVNFE